MNKKVLQLMILFFILGCLAMAACSGWQSDSDTLLAWTEPGSNDISDVLRKTEEMPYLKSLIVIKNGEVIIEKYMNGGGPEVYTDLKSASKSILSAVLGVAINKGYLDSIDQKVMDFFPEHITADLDPRIFDLRIRHLIKMKAGFKVKESSKAYEQLYQSSDWIRHILHLPFKTAPGKKFNYHSFNTHLLSAIIARATSMSTLQFSKQALFSPLNINKVLWEKDPNGYHIGGWGMSLTARDMAKIGSLYLNGGVFKGTKIVPAEWIKRSTTERVGMIGTYYSGWDKSYGYGYLWWVKRINGTIDIPFALGHGGQRIAIIPELMAAVITQADPKVKPSASHKHHRAIDSFIFKDIMTFLLKSEGNP